jgi:hypothetical protein
MPTKIKTARTGTLSVREGKVRKEFWLDPNLLRRAREDLGARTEREAVEMALSLVSFRRELRDGARALRKLKLSRID